jgi:hypothetical protein
MKAARRRLGFPSQRPIRDVHKKYLWGQYQIGLSAGSLQGELHEFGGEQVLIFGYEGMDEMAPASGGGWMRILDEFMGSLGHFTASASQLKKLSAKARKR